MRSQTSKTRKATVDLTDLSVNVFAEHDRPTLVVLEKQDSNGSWSLPRELVRDLRTARGELDRAETAILEYLRGSGQHIPWPFPGHVPLTVASAIDSSPTPDGADPDSTDPGEATARAVMVGDVG